MSPYEYTPAELALCEACHHDECIDVDPEDRPPQCSGPLWHLPTARGLIQALPGRWALVDMDALVETAAKNWCESPISSDIDGNPWERESEAEKGWWREDVIKLLGIGTS